MKQHLALLRPKDWAKNGFLFIPLFFSGSLFQHQALIHLLIGFVSFSCAASAIYIVNDYRDIEDDRRHPIKRKRPLAAGTVSIQTALILSIALLVLSITTAWLADSSGRFLIIIGIYLLMNLAYTFYLKNISILDIMIVAAGFVLRVKAGGILADVELSLWLNMMVFLLAMFLAIAKRRDDTLLKLQTGDEMRKSIKGYNIEYLNTMLGLFAAIIIMAYLMYCASPITYERLKTHHLYYTSIFVIAAMMRYLQLALVQNKAGSPTEILFKDRFIQITMILWIASFYAILYMKGITWLDQ
jgi:4-hydroxybenzoate polyprenyltransferase